MSQRRVPVCPRDGSCLSQGRFPFVPNTVPPKMFMCIVFSCPIVFQPQTFTSLKQQTPHPSPCKKSILDQSWSVSVQTDKSLALPLCRNVLGTFVVQILEDFAGDFLGIFLGTFSWPSQGRRSARRIFWCFYWLFQVLGPQNTQQPQGRNHQIREGTTTHGKRQVCNTLVRRLLWTIVRVSLC